MSDNDTIHINAVDPITVEFLVAVANAREDDRDNYGEDFEVGKQLDELITIHAREFGKFAGLVIGDPSYTAAQKIANNLLVMEQLTKVGAIVAAMYELTDLMNCQFEDKGK